ERPQRIDYERAVHREPGELVALRIVGTEAVHEVALNGREVGRITPLWPVLNLTPHLEPSTETSLRVSAVRSFNEDLGRAELLRGVSAEQWTVAPADVAGLVASAARDRDGAVQAALPLDVPAGEGRW